MKTNWHIRKVSVIGFFVSIRSWNIASPVGATHDRDQTWGSTRMDDPCWTVCTEKSWCEGKQTAWAGRAVSMKEASSLRGSLCHGVVGPSDKSNSSTVSSVCGKQLSSGARHVQSISFDLVTMINEQSGSKDDPSNNHAKPILTTCSWILKVRGTRKPCPFRKCRHHKRWSHCDFHNDELLAALLRSPSSMHRSNRWSRSGVTQQKVDPLHPHQC